ncbi:MAG: hypothetical protein Q9204_007675 [Flavoplaca sp. TL-2023a]
MKASFFSIIGLLTPLATSIPVLNVDIHITDDTHVGNSLHVLNPTPETSLATTSEKIPGWAFFAGDTLLARVHGNTFWKIKGKLDEKLPIDDFLFDPLRFTLSHPIDFEGTFNGTIGKGEVSLAWEKSGATITGKSPVGDFEVKGESTIDFSP